MTYEELDARKRELQRKRQRLVDSGKSPALLDKLISKAQRAMNEVKTQEKSAVAPPSG